jgi:very-short-patch-repair endonuclease
MGGFKFRRQAPIGPYVADFVCFEKKVIIELDGGQHQEQAEYDSARSDWLASEGYTVLRFWNHEVFKEEDAVLATIWKALGLEE